MAIVTEYSNSVNATERTLRQQAEAMQPMTFYPSEPDIVVRIGDQSVTMYFCPAIYIHTSDGVEREFTSRLKADIYFAQQIRRLRYLHGFDICCAGKPEPEDKDERRGWRAALDAEAQADAYMAQQEEHDAKIEAQGWFR